MMIVIGIPNSVYLLNKFQSEYLIHGNKIKAMSRGMMGDKEMETRGAIMGGLLLYLAFVMLFIHLLQILGNRR